MGKTFTLTFGDSAENHVGMQKIGTIANSGFTLEDLERASKWFELKGITTELHTLQYGEYKGYFLIARNGVNAILGDDYTLEEFYTEQDLLEKDKKALMYGRVVNKTARHNLCFGYEGQEPNYEAGKGRIIPFDQVPILSHIRTHLPSIVGDKAMNLMVEGNYYYDTNKCGIGFHGDAERRKVIGIRLGDTMPLEFQWFHERKSVGERIKFNLNGGDVYIMSEKTVGTDWKKRKIPTLRHAAGCNKFLKI